jgi:hypothetical protein
MAKKAWIERNKRRLALVQKHAAARAEFKARGDYAGAGEAAPQCQPGAPRQPVQGHRAPARLFTQIWCFTPDLPRDGPLGPDPRSDQG